jgi:uncharacterized protein (DUF608 family)
MPVGGIGTGTVSFCGNGSWRHWEIMNRPAKGFVPSSTEVEPFFALRVATPSTAWMRVLEGPLPVEEFEGSHGSPAPNANLPRFRSASFATAYPFARVLLADPDLPITAEVRGFNPLVPGDAEASGLPLAVIQIHLRNHTTDTLEVSVSASLPNFIGLSPWTGTRDWKGDLVPAGASRNRNAFRSGESVSGLLLTSGGVDSRAETWGTLSLVTTDHQGLSYRTAWAEGDWWGGLLDFWDDFSEDGRLEERKSQGTDMPMGSLVVSRVLPAGGELEIPFLLTWHFPNRYSWDVEPGKETPEDWVGNYYCTRFHDAWQVAEETAPRLPELRDRTARFVKSLLESSYPDTVKEAALFNLSTLRSQTVFRTADGYMFGWEGCGDNKGCCFGSCTHVWNYEQATPYLFGELALRQREIEFVHATDERGAMSFRVGLPLEKAARSFRQVAADGQMGCLLKMYRDWRLSGRDDLLQAWWGKIRAALEFCWVPGGWDADRDGVMEGVQHNTMDVEYLGPNPEIQFWYLGALRAVEEMALRVGDTEFADTCRALFDNGSRWTDSFLFNGEYYEQIVRPLPADTSVPPVFRAGMGARDLTKPDYQLASGCLVDQLVGQYVAHLCGLGHLADPQHIRSALGAIWKYNRRETLMDHFNPLRTFALDGEAGLIIASYPKDRPEKPFPYFAEVWTGLEYTAAVGMVFEGLEAEGATCFRQARQRYDGFKRNPFDEAECGHHYVRAMAAWAAIPAWSRFLYSASAKLLQLTGRPGTYFWSNGHAWGTCVVGDSVRLVVFEGKLPLEEFRLDDGRLTKFPKGHVVTGILEFTPQVESGSTGRSEKRKP